MQGKQRLTLKCCKSPLGWAKIQHITTKLLLLLLYLPLLLSLALLLFSSCSFCYYPIGAIDCSGKEKRTSYYYCCDDGENKCGHDEGHCKSSSHCESGLNCLTGMCNRSQPGFAGHSYSCCLDPGTLYNIFLLNIKPSNSDNKPHRV